MIAGNGRFPVLALEAARQLGLDLVVVAIREEAGPELERLAPKYYSISLGELGKLIRILKDEQICQVMMCGQVKHAKIFSSIVPDWRLVKLLASLPSKNTDGLIGGVRKHASSHHPRARVPEPRRGGPSKAPGGVFGTRGPLLGLHAGAGSA